MEEKKKTSKKEDNNFPEFLQDLVKERMALDKDGNVYTEYYINCG